MAEKKTTRTVRDFKEHLLRVAGVASYFEFNKRSDAHMNLWQKLNSAGARNMGTIPPETVSDIDATVSLSENEWNELEAELQKLL